MKYNKFFLLAIVLFVVSALSAQDIISAKDLAKIIKNKDVVVVCTSSKKGYKVHIPGSVNIPQISLANTEPFHNMVKPADEMAAILGAKGVSADKTIVLYDGGSGKYAGRMYWILKYLGAPKVKVLDGNMKAWKAARKPITGAPTKVKATTFTPNVDAAQLASMADVKSAIGNSSFVLVDVRPPADFNGTATTELRKGHIPGAVNIEFTHVMDSKGLLKSNEQLKSLFQSKGVKPDKTIILYCESSVRAGIVYLALKGLNYPNVKVYDGAYIEWQATASNKVE
jgi:thiosulfate/3-mercaptopyruvate sulfurtransferase